MEIEFELLAPDLLVFSEGELRVAINHVCSCGGKGPADPGVCEACLVWHTLMVMRPSKDRIRELPFGYYDYDPPVGR